MSKEKFGDILNKAIFSPSAQPGTIKKSGKDDNSQRKSKDSAREQRKKEGK